MKRAFTTLTLCLSFLFIHAQEECSRRYQDKIFTELKRTESIQYAEAPMPGGGLRQLMFDVYEPVGDTLSLRPVVALMHGGAFIDIFNRRSPDILAIAHELTLRGYVCISIGYRGIRNIASILNERDMVQAVGRAIIDANDAFCFIQDQALNGGNPFKIDMNQVMSLGVSAGGVIGLQGIFLDNLDQLTPQQKNWVMEVDGGRAESALANKYCGAELKAFVNVAGCLIDTSWIRPNTTDVLLIHGTADPIMPYNVDYPLGLPTLPKMYGSGAIYEKAQEVGATMVLKAWEGKGHVPFLKIDLLDILSLNLVDQEIFDQSIEDIKEFFFERITCEPARVVSNVRPGDIKALSVFPNPNSGSYEINLPAAGNWLLEIRDVSGRLMKSELFSGNRFSGDFGSAQNGLYLLQVSDIDAGKEMFSGKLILSR
jgi:acetyl esterase/lipase